MRTEMRIENHVGRDSVARVRLAMGWMVHGSKPGGGDIYHTGPDGPWGPLSLLRNGYRVIPEGKAAGAWL